MGMNAQTGKSLDGIDHIKQSITDILATPTGTRIMRREYGSALPFLIDKPLNNATLLQCYAATAIALALYEPRIRLESVNAEIKENTPGVMYLKLSLTRLDVESQQTEQLEINLT